MAQDESSAGGGPAPVRVVTVVVPSRQLSAALFGAGSDAQLCEVVLRNMLPLPERVTLQAVLSHGLVLELAPSAQQEMCGPALVVPWSQVSYIRPPGVE